MASERKTGAGARFSGVLERAATQPDRPEADEPDLDVDQAEQADHEPDQEPVEPTPQRSRGGSPRKPRTLAARTARRIKGRTIYLPDDLFERLLVQSHRRGLTISDYVTGILERGVPDHRAGDAA